jgi:hypothetical protein
MSMLLGVYRVTVGIGSPDTFWYLRFPFGLCIHPLYKLEEAF